MKKFLLPIINLVNLVLISITWGLSGKTAVTDKLSSRTATYYTVLWEGHPGNALGIVGFFLFIVACALTLFAFLPVKVRKYATCVAGASYIAAGVLFLVCPHTFSSGIQEPKLTGALIAMAVLVFVAGAFSLCMSAIELFAKKESK